tara:strand:+ start:1756 stop:5355 length:3600 start_codon:yes stop_codon:yes gene_type:complete
MLNNTLRQMKLSKLSSLFLAISLFSIELMGQMSDKEKLTEAFYLMDESRFAEALVLLESVYKNDKNNANINFNIGVAILNSNDVKSKEKALPYLKAASENTSPNYKPFNPREDRAPVDTWYHLGLSQHSQYQFNEAKESFEKFRTFINDKHPLWSEIDKRINMAKYAQYALDNPINIKSENLGNKLNSFYPEYSPVVRIDESAIYFTSRRLRKDSSNLNQFDPYDGQRLEDIYVSYNDNGTWSEPTMLNISSTDNEATLNISIDGKTLFIYKDENSNGELYFSNLLNDSAGIETWSEPKKFGSDINSKAYETHVAISPDQRTLYFVSEREGGLGGRDIYYCNILPNGNWALAQNIGSIINTSYDEDGVFMHPDGKTLYFSSNGHNSMGGYDIMYSTLTDSGWTVPKNMGYPINSVDDDVFFVTTPDGKRAYYSSFKEGGFGEKDIYLIQLLDADESNLTLYRGEFTFVDRMSPPQGAQITIINNNTSELVGVYSPRQRDGQFSAILEADNSYHFIYEADGYDSYEEDIYVPSGASYQEIYKDIKLKPVRVGRGMTAISPAMMRKADVNGAITKNGVAMQSKRIILFSEDGEVVQETTSDVKGVFDFKQLEPSKGYKLVAYADEKTPLTNYEIDVKNDRGEKVVTKVINDSTHLFVPSQYPFEFYGIRSKSIAGRVKSGDKPLAGLIVRLEDQNRSLIQQTETDQYGEFNFNSLNLDNSYRIIFDGKFPEDPTILITNDQGEVLSFRKVREGVYEYVPSSSKKGTQFIGTAKRGGTALSGVSVSLLDGNGKLISQSTTDGSGGFKFENLDLNQTYRLQFGEEFPDDGIITIYDEYGNILVFKNIGDGIFEYVPESENKGNKLRGIVKRNGKALNNIAISLLDGNGKLIQQSTTDAAGEFIFEGLDLSKNYMLQFDGDFPDDATILLLNEFGQELVFAKKGPGLYEYMPNGISKLGSEIQAKITQKGKSIGGFAVQLENEKGELLDQSEVDKAGEFSFKSLNLDNRYRIVFDENLPKDAELVFRNEYGQILTFMKVKQGVYEYVPRPAQFAFKSYTIGVEGNPDFEETYPKPGELKDVIAYFQRYFPYNAKDIDESNKEFIMFIDDVAELVKSRGYADIIITSSASKVPTRTWKSNSILTKKRANDAKRLLEKVFFAKGLEETQFNFVDLNTLITGPEYNYDHIKNRPTYEKHQYVRIFIK